VIQEFELAKQTAVETSNLLRLKFFNNSGILSEKGKDIKTEADMAAHNYIIDKLEKTGIKVYSEESNDNSFNINDQQWIIDPIDGTLNFSRGFPIAAISIALWDKGKPILGVIHNIFSGEKFTAVKNKGSFLNGEKISVSSISKKENAVIATGFPSGGDYSDSSLMSFIRKVQDYKKIRMLGSASLMLAYVACGYFDLYNEKNIYIWDVAAGLMLVNEAGGTYIINSGSSNVKFNIEASNSLLNSQKSKK